MGAAIEDLLARLQKTPAPKTVPAPNPVRHKITPGDIVKIQFSEHFHTYGRVLLHGRVAIYDCKTETDIADLDVILKCPVLFYTVPYDYTIKCGHWKIIGNHPLEEMLKKPLPQFLQDRTNPYECQLVYGEWDLHDALYYECIGLERVAVWAPEHVEERIRDYYDGKPNDYVEHFKVIIPDENPIGPVRPFSITTLDGNTLLVDATLQCPVILYFWSVMVFDCAIKLAHFERLHQQYGNEELLIIGINGVMEYVNSGILDDRINCQSFVREYQLTFPITLDTDHSIQQLYDINGRIPSTVFIDADGIIQLIISGALTEPALSYGLQRIGLER